MLVQLLVLIVQRPRTESGGQSTRFAIPVPQMTRVHQVILVVPLVFSDRTESRRVVHSSISRVSRSYLWPHQAGHAGAAIVNGVTTALAVLNRLLIVDTDISEIV